jgi:hypothetical protein
MRRYLIVANRTLGGEQLSAKLAECASAGPCRFYLAAPVTQTEASDRWAAGRAGGVVPRRLQDRQDAGPGAAAARTGPASPGRCGGRRRGCRPTPRRRDPHAGQPRGGRPDHVSTLPRRLSRLDGHVSAAPRPACHQTAGDPHQRTGRPLALTAHGRGRRGALGHGKATIEAYGRTPWLGGTAFGGADSVSHRAQFARQRSSRSSPTTKVRGRRNGYQDRTRSSGGTRSRYWSASCWAWLGLPGGLPLAGPVGGCGC